MILDDSAFSKLETLEKARNTFQEETFTKIGQEKVESLKEMIVELDSLIEERQDLSKLIEAEVNKIKMDVENFLLENVATDTDGFRERNGLRQKQIDVSELLLNEKVNCFRDVAMLKRELRERKRELTEKEDRMQMLDGILK